MKIAFVFIVATLISCGGKTERVVSKPSQILIAGTWKLITGTHIENDDTIITDYTKNISFIKIINDTHFAFLHTNVNKGKGFLCCCFRCGWRQLFA